MRSILVTPQEFEQWLYSIMRLWSEFMAAIEARDRNRIDASHMRLNRFLNDSEPINYRFQGQRWSWHTELRKLQRLAAGPSAGETPSRDASM
jgi:hypothetical protein